MQDFVFGKRDIGAFAVGSMALCLAGYIWQGSGLLEGDEKISNLFCTFEIETEEYV